MDWRTTAWIGCQKGGVVQFPPPALRQVQATTLPWVESAKQQGPQGNLYMQQKKVLFLVRVAPWVHGLAYNMRTAFQPPLVLMAGRVLLSGYQPLNSLQLFCQVRTHSSGSNLLIPREVQGNHGSSRPASKRGPESRCPYYIEDKAKGVNITLIKHTKWTEKVNTGGLRRSNGL